MKCAANLARFFANSETKVDAEALSLLLVDVDADVVLASEAEAEEAGLVGPVVLNGPLLLT